jgi:enoyl-CoA hydratase
VSVPSNFSCLSATVENGVAHLRLNRPDLLNRFDEVLHSEFPRALAWVSEQQVDLAALLISAEGRAFSAGGDMDMMLRANRSKAMRERLMGEGIAIIDGLLAMPFPVVAAVQGAAVGLGASVVGCCDIVVAARQVKIADPHVQLGLVAGDGGVLAWSQSMGVMRAKRYLLTGDAITGEQAYALGMVSDLVDTPEEVLPAARALAGRFASLPRNGVRGTKRAFSRLTKDLYGAAFELSFAYEMEALAGDELRETVEAVITANLDRKK